MEHRNKAYADCETWDKKLYVALRHFRDFKTAQYFIKRGANINSHHQVHHQGQHQINETILEDALLRYEAGVMAYALQLGANPNLLCSHGQPPLIVALARGSYFADLLLRSGADVNQVFSNPVFTTPRVTTPRVTTPLLSIVSLPYSIREVNLQEPVSKLLKAGGDPMIQDGIGHDVDYYVSEGLKEFPERFAGVREEIARHKERVAVEARTSLENCTKVSWKYLALIVREYLYGK